MTNIQLITNPSNSLFSDYYTKVRIFIETNRYTIKMTSEGSNAYIDDISYQCDDAPNLNSEEGKITEWFAHTNVLITGATGFLGKLIVEKLLRYVSFKDIFKIPLILSHPSVFYIILLCRVDRKGSVFYRINMILYLKKKEVLVYIRVRIAIAFQIDNCTPFLELF